MPQNSRGFTLVELLLVMVVLGVLATIVIPKFNKTRERAFVSSMQSDLRNLATAQEFYYSENNNFTYTNSLAALGFQESEGVDITFGEADNLGWSAVATHVASPIECAVFYGEAGPVGVATDVGVVTCDTP